MRLRIIEELLIHETAAISEERTTIRPAELDQPHTEQLTERWLVEFSATVADAKLH